MTKQEKKELKQLREKYRSITMVLEEFDDKENKGKFIFVLKDKSKCSRKLDGKCSSCKHFKAYMPIPLDRVNKDSVFEGFCSRNFSEKEMDAFIKATQEEYKRIYEEYHKSNVLPNCPQCGTRLKEDVYGHCDTGECYKHSPTMDCHGVNVHCESCGWPVVNGL